MSMVSSFKPPILSNNNNSLFKSSSTNTTNTTNSSTPSPGVHHERRRSYSESSNNDLNGNSDTTKDEVPLSMSFLHKPKRSDEFFKQSNDPTKLNSLLNKKIESPRDDDEIPPDYFNHKHYGGNILEENHDTTQSSDLLSSSSSSSPSSISTPKLNNPIFQNDIDSDYKLVRKKSGELVKPSLKSPSFDQFKKRSMSLPTTPTFKQVHFGDSNDIRYFKQKDRPTAVSATNSPTFGNLVSDDDDDYDDNERYSDSEIESSTSTKDFHNFSLLDTHYPNKISFKPNWQLKLLNFPPLSYAKKVDLHVPVFLEKLFISQDKKFLFGYIAVKNLAYSKHLTVRYTLDSWQTIIEIPTIYTTNFDVEILKNNDYDRFYFKIPLNNLFNSFKFNSSTDSLSDDSKKDLSNSSKNYQLCIKYCVDNQEYWDNNNFQNYKIKLTKTMNSNLPEQQQSNSKIQQHSSRPKYSSKYVKNHKQEDNEDYEKNNYYITSPLLGSIQKNQDDDLLRNTEDKSIKSKEQPKYKKTFRDQLKNSNFNDELIPKIDPSIKNNNKKNNFLSSKSYKELLENYCFFNDTKINEDNDKKDSYSVSSFLGT
ncbi:unnamed protein product [Candida verbasci]|uniref:CBM21 domain-containing protein n=1 Tax=Candida verbasci TaxID=1227364 RepID=A0A9W4XL14_9ASCO|nr:unnamed protein product [Candida verbasci]